jgi:hypothetical protein
MLDVVLGGVKVRFLSSHSPEEEHNENSVDQAIDELYHK